MNELETFNMPPEGKKPSAEDAKKFRKWIDLGYPETKNSKGDSGDDDDDDDC